MAGWLLLTLAIRIMLATLTPLFPDESYYWEWSRHLAAGYFDHPPGIAWAIAAGTSLLGDNVAGVRMLPILFGSITQAAAVAVAASVGGSGLHPNGANAFGATASVANTSLSGASSSNTAGANAGAAAAVRAAVASALLPIATLGLVLATPDAPLFAFTTIAVLCVDRALASSSRSARSTLWWLGAGIAIGFALLSKYSAILVPAALAVAFVIHPLLRKRLGEPGPWLAAVVAFAVFSPVIWWNLQNEFISFRFQLGHGFGGGAKGSIISRELALFGGQLALATPILAVLMGVALWRSLASLRSYDHHREHHSQHLLNARLFAIAAVAAMPLVFFAISATRKNVEANWPALAYPAAIIVLAVSANRGVLKRWWNRAMWCAAVILTVAVAQVVHPVLPLAPRKDPIARAYGWDRLAQVVDSVAATVEVEGDSRLHLASERYQDASELAFHIRGQPEVMAISIASRKSQYDLWYDPTQIIGKGDHLVASFDANPDGDTRAKVVGVWFEKTVEGPTVALQRNGKDVAHRKVWVFIRANNVSVSQHVSQHANTLLSDSASIRPSYTVR